MLPCAALDSCLARAQSESESQEEKLSNLLAMFSSAASPLFILAMIQRASQHLATAKTLHPVVGDASSALSVTGAVAENAALSIDDI